VKLSRRLTIEPMVGLGEVSRPGLYRFEDGSLRVASRDVEVRDAIQHTALEWRSSVRPRITDCAGKPVRSIPRERTGSCGRTTCGAGGGGGS